MKKPKQLEEFDLTELTEACQDVIDFYENFDYQNADEDKQSDYWEDVQGKAMVAIFGEDVFEYINSKT